MDFLQKIEQGLLVCGLSCAELFRKERVIGFGVSGGADSMALLFSAIMLRKKFWGNNGAEFIVITINHNIRPKEESASDAIFVKDFCKRKDKVTCQLIELEQGYVESLAKQRGRGLEEAARHIRYEIFNREAKSRGCEYFFLAHNQNDQLETLLLRFLQGSGEAGSQGILPVREIFIRPMLQINRDEIEDFLLENNISWVTDKSNFENDYLRNRCRNLLTPLLNKEFTGWQRAVLSGAKKAFTDNDFISSQVPKSCWVRDKENNLFMSWNYFLSFHPALRRRILYDGLNQMGLHRRIPFHLVQGLSEISTKYTKGRVFSSGHLEICGEKENLVIKLIKQQESKDFSMTIDSAGRYLIPDLGITITVEENKESSSCLCLCGQNFLLPFVLRSPHPGDRYLKDNKEKSAMRVNSKDDDAFTCVVEECGKNNVTIINLSQFMK